ncbi:flavoprotein, partial [Zhengella mangrovi]
MPQQIDEILDSQILHHESDHEGLDELIAADHLLVANDAASLLGLAEVARSSAPSFHLRPGQPQCGNLVVGCTGSVVAGLMAQTILSLRFSGFQEQLDVILTDTATRFVTREFIEAYGIRVWRDGFEQQDNLRVPHVALASSANLICVIPATADALDRIARSACNDLLSLTITASKAPVVLAP